ncbi:UNVERIFIED_CONTAM: hypothetical protein PYX00_011446 [Menopon gallinae]|uniref:Uncharacterized protein n=1 Tax=Menopon gallinae TaxID=328185 RepID=A0AAW2H7T2_9NEOP
MECRKSLNLSNKKLVSLLVDLCLLAAGGKNDMEEEPDRVCLTKGYNDAVETVNKKTKPWDELPAHYYSFNVPHPVSSVSLAGAQMCRENAENMQQMHVKKHPDAGSPVTERDRKNISQSLDEVWRATSEGEYRTPYKRSKWEDSRVLIILTVAGLAQD